MSYSLYYCVVNVGPYAFNMPTLIVQWGWVSRYRARVIIAGSVDCLPAITGAAILTLHFLSAKASGFAPVIISTMP